METKTKVSYNITKSVLSDFDKVSKEKAINKSGLIELLILEWLRKNK